MGQNASQRASRFWGFTQTWAWIAFRDMNLAIKVGEDPIVSEEVQIELPEVFGGPYRMKVTRREARSHHYLESMGKNHGLDHEVVASAFLELEENLQIGNLRSYGRRNNRGSLVRIPAVQWIDLEIKKDYHVGWHAKSKLRSLTFAARSGPSWYDLRFREVELKKIWPEIKNSGEYSGSKNSSPLSDGLKYGVGANPPHRPRDLRDATKLAICTLYPMGIKGIKQAAVVTELQSHMRGSGQPMPSFDTVRRALKELGSSKK